MLFMNRQDTSQINQSTDYHKSLLNLCKVNILQKKVATAMVTTRLLKYSIFSFIKLMNNIMAITALYCTTN